MKKKELWAVASNRMDRVEILAKSVLKSFEIEDVHLFRVEVKKLRAFLRLLRKESGDREALRLSRGIKKFYEAAGLVRNWQLQEKRIRQVVREGELELPRQYFQWMELETARLIGLARALAESEKGWPGWNNSSLEPALPEKLGKAAVHHYLQTKSGDLQHLLAPYIPADGTMHEIRKLLKDLMYNRPYLHSLMGEDLPAGLIHPENLKELTEALGEFQDACTGIQLLKEGATRVEMPENERILLLNTLWEWENDREGRRQYIYRDLLKFQLIPAVL